MSAIFAVGATSFILQRYYEETWAKNTMMQVLVDDLDGWWKRIMSLDLPNKFESLHRSHPKCSLGDFEWPTSTIRQAYYGILLSADPATPPIRVRRCGHSNRTYQCPLLRLKRTSASRSEPRPDRAGCLKGKFCDSLFFPRMEGSHEAAGIPRTK